MIKEPTLYAINALFMEVYLAPKPGLVDRFTQGAHDDMTYATFIRSINALEPFLYRYLQIGTEHTGSISDLFIKLREVGKVAEIDMLQATKGINTHKGANFSFALLLGATGYYFKKNNLTLPITPNDTNQILKIVSKMTTTIVQTDFSYLAHKRTLSHGEKIYLETGNTGIRGEASNGYPTLRRHLLPFMRTSTIETTELFLLRSLIYLMSKLNDSNILHRGGVVALRKIQFETKKIHQKNLSAKEFFDELQKYDTILSDRYLSPGGSADLLSLGIYFSFLEGLLSLSSGQKI